MLGFSEQPAFAAQARETLRVFGVGTCGPRGFYGTLDVHLQLEGEIAVFLQTQDAIIYSQAFSAVSSTIPAFSKRSDVLVVDELCGAAVRRGVEISRSRAFFFRHNDVGHLAEVLAEAGLAAAPGCRKFIVSEGLFSADSSLCPLPEVVALKRQFGFRLILDETLSVGALGRHGRGASEHWQVPIAELDILVGSMAHAMAAGGGFCAGSAQVVDHQRLSSQAYCFSASLPAVLTTAAQLALKQMAAGEAAGLLAERTASLAAALAGSGLQVLGAAASPAKFLLFAGSEAADAFVAEAAAAGLLLGRADGVRTQAAGPELAAVRVAASAGYSAGEMQLLLGFLSGK